MIRTYVFTLLALLSTAGCDPGWTYRVPGASARPNDGSRYMLAETDGVAGTLRSWMFAGELVVEIEIVNQAGDPLHLDPESLRVVDARGALLQKLTGHHAWPSRWTSPAPGLIVEAGRSYRLSDEFLVDPFSGILPNRDLKVITVYLDGLSRAGRAIPLRVTLERE